MPALVISKPPASRPSGCDLAGADDGANARRPQTCSGESTQDEKACKSRTSPILSALILVTVSFLSGCAWCRSSAASSYVFTARAICTVYSVIAEAASTCWYCDIGITGNFDMQGMHGDLKQLVYARNLAIEDCIQIE